MMIVPKAVDIKFILSVFLGGNKNYSTDTEAECSEEEPVKKFKTSPGKESATRKKAIDESSILTGNFRFCLLYTSRCV